MILSILKETNDPRVALGPPEIKKLLSKGISVWVESTAGKQSLIKDASYLAAGANIFPRKKLLSEADLIIGVNPILADELIHCKKGAVLITSQSPEGDEQVLSSMKDQELVGFGLDRMPRTTRAQAMDVLSSMSSLAGYRAVLLAAMHFPGYFPLMMTAAGTIPPAKILILGVGVAGLQAIATAKRLGARVEAFDIRPDTKQEVESLGAKFVNVPGLSNGQANSPDPETLKRRQVIINEHIGKSNVVITAAQVRGRKAPILVSDEALDGMQEGSVIIDLAAETGGNCTQTINQQTITYKGIKIIGNSQLAAEMPVNASSMLSTNFFHFVSLMIKEGKLEIDWEDDILTETCYTT